MINKLKYYITDNTNPYRNLATEEYLMKSTEDGDCVLFLWQNRNTVVIGRNQNARKEVKVDRLAEDGGFLARRMSGGGAVYHDLGNLNFTFLVRRTDYDVSRQCDVILEAVRRLGIDAEQTGRNDIIADGKKFSGNAYLDDGLHCCHHGTIMVNVDGKKLAGYLNVSLDKLRSKGVSSIKSRVTNLAALNPGITVDAVRRELLEAFQKVYGQSASELELNDSDWSEIERLADRFASPEWLEGHSFPMDFEISERFDWGGVTLAIRTEGGCVAECAVYTDGMDADFAAPLEKDLLGVRLNRDAMITAISGADADEASEGGAESVRAMRRDICRMIADKL